MNVDVLGVEKFENPQVGDTVDDRRDQADQSGRDQIERHVSNQRQLHHQKAVDCQRCRILELPTEQIETEAS